ncbi:hypothetical protein HAX54_045583, partial [Datura stramonium]|nr:hypothetical protein [Datura stramonium]
DCNLNMVREFLANWDPKERSNHEEEKDYKPVYDPRGIDVSNTKEPEGIHSPGLSINERNAQIGNMLDHMYGMQMLQLRMDEVTEE